jgi:hypothetical protein
MAEAGTLHGVRGTTYGSQGGADVAKVLRLCMKIMYQISYYVTCVLAYCVIEVQANYVL